MPRTFVLFNPSSHSGETGLRLAELEQLLAKHVGRFELRSTTRPGDGVQLTRDAVDDGARRIIVAGGDGTVSEALSGVLSSEHSSDVELAILPLGTGRDFARMLGLGTDLQSAVARIENGKRRTVDAGRVTCRVEKDEDRSRYFMNIASVGVPAEATRWLEERMKRGKKRGPLSYVASGIVGLFRYTMPRVTVSVDDRAVFTGTLSLLATANGEYFGGGMPVAPGASIDDGELDVVIVQGMSRLASMALYPALLRGRHVDNPLVHLHHGKRVHIESEEEVWVEADGELIGTLPATVEILPGSVHLCGLP